MPFALRSQEARVLEPEFTAVVAVANPALAAEQVRMQDTAAYTTCDPLLPEIESREVVVVVHGAVLRVAHCHAWAYVDGVGRCTSCSRPICSKAGAACPWHGWPTFSRRPPS